MKELLNKCRLFDQKPDKDNQDNFIPLSQRFNENLVKFFDAKKERALDERTEPGAIEFKSFMIERFFYVMTMKKDNKEIQKKFYELMRKYLRNETEEIGRNKFFLITSHLDKISEQYLRHLNELISCLNENMNRIKDVWEININSRPEKAKIRNSFEIFNLYTSIVTLYYKNFCQNKNERPDFNGIENTYVLQFRQLEDSLINNMKKVILFMKTVQNEKIDNNYKGIVLEKFLLFLHQIFLLFLRIKAHKGLRITKDEAEIMCDSCHFMIKNGTMYGLIDASLRFFWELITFTNYNQNEENNYFYTELFYNWKKYFDFEVHLKNKNRSEGKVNIVLNYFIKFYHFSIKENGNNILLFQKLHKEIQDDNYNMVKKLIEKLNDFEVSLDNKVSLINLIYIFLNREQAQLSFDDLYFILNQMTNFFKIFYSLNQKDEYIGTFLKEEKQIQKENYQKDMLKINLENNEQHNLLYKRYNLNSIFYNLTKSKYDKYIYIKDVKHLYGILKPLPPQPNQQYYSSYEVIQKLITLFKDKLKNNSKISSDEYGKSIKIDKLSSLLCKFFFYYFYIYEKLKSNHQAHDPPQEQNKILELYIDEFTEEEENNELLVPIFTKLMPYIFELYKYGLKICPVKSCISARLVHNIFKTIKKEKNKEKVFLIYFEFFSLKIFETGNPKEIFNPELNSIANSNSLILNESINNITILKSIFFNLLECISDFNQFKNLIIPLIIDILYLSKNSEYYGNYIYILRCFFKYLKTAISQFNSNMQQDDARQKKKKLSDEFNIEINYILYAIIKYLVNIKEKAPFFNEMITEIIMILPVKQRFLIEIPHLIFPSLVDNLINGSENIQLNLMNLENWMGVYIKNAESVVPFIQQYLSKITDLLSANLLSSANINICLASLKWLSKLGGKGRNYFKEKRIISKTCPMQILTMKLKEKKENRSMDFILDYIIDIDIDNCINWSSKTMHKKSATAADKKLIFNYVEIYKNCLSAFFHKKIDYNYILEIKKNIINGNKDFNEKEFNSDFSFRQMNEKNSKIKINNFFRKKEHFIIGKIITGYFLINSSYIQIQNLQKDAFFAENDLMEFISNYFLMILLSKEKNNKNMLLFEQDPILFLDEIIQFLFSSHPTIIKNTNVQLTEYSLKIINNIIESINKFFDYDNNIIKNLEIVDIIYMKFLNCCYISESPKIDLGLMLIKVLLQKFDKCINFKYLKYFFKCISSVTSNYSNIVNIQFKKGCNNLVEVIELLINIFIINDPNYDLLTENIFDNEKNNLMIVEENTNNDLQNTKNNFLMLFEFAKYCFDEIIEKIDTDNNYTRNVGVYLIEKIIGKLPRMKYLIPYLMQLDINSFSIKDFLKFFKKAKNQMNYRTLLYHANYNTISEENNSRNRIENREYILPNFEKKKIFKKLNNIFNTLTKKLGLRENSFTYLITCSDALNNIFYISPNLIEEFIFSDNSDSGNNKIELYLEVIQSLYFNILISYYSYCQISIYIHDFTETFKSRLVYLFMEQSLVEKNLEHDFEIYDDNRNKIVMKNEVENEYIKYIENYINENSIYRNEVNTRDHIVAEIFENLNLRINMVINYIKLLDNMFTKFKNYFTKEKRTEKEFDNYTSIKKSTCQLIFLQILNLHTASIIKQSSKFLCDIFKDDTKLKEEIFNKNDKRIYALIELITINNIKESNCAIIQDMISKLQKENMNALIIIGKSMGLNESMKQNLIKCINHFENISNNEFENSQIVLFYGYISIFLYVDISNDEETLIKIFNQILKRFEEKLTFPSKNLLNFTRTKYKGTVMKFITKHRNAFSKFVIGKSEVKTNSRNIENKCIIELIKTISEDDKNTLICETLFKEITNEFKNNIINKDEYNYELLFKIYQLLKICKIISKFLRIYLKSTSLLKIIDEYIKSMVKYCENNLEYFKKNSICQKIFKTWIKLHIFYIETFLDKKPSLDSLFFYRSMSYVSAISKNKIDFVLTYQFSFTDERNFEKNYISIMNSFMTLDSETKKYFDLYVEKLIIPLMINYYKSRNFFLCYNVSLNKEMLEIEKKEKEKENENENINDIDEEKIDNKITFNEEYLIYTLYNITSRLVRIKFKKEKKEENKYKLLCILIILYKEYLSRKKINKNYSEKIRTIHNNIESMLYYSHFYDKKTQVLFWRIYLFFGICLFTEQNDKEEKKNLEIIFNFSKSFNDEYAELQNLTYELFLPYSKNDESLFCLFRQHVMENLNYGIYFLKIIQKFPTILNYCSDKTTKDLLSNIYEMLGRVKNLANNKKIFLQTIGLFTLNISNIRNNRNNTNEESEKYKHHLETANFTIAYRFYRYILQLINQEPDGLDTLKKLLYYFREICNNPTKNSFNFEFKFQEFPKLIHVHVQMLRICFLYFGYEFLYANKKNVEHCFIVDRLMIDSNVNHRIFNDFMLILRLYSDQDTLYKLNTKEKIHDIYVIDFKRNLMNQFKELIKDRNFMKDKITNYEINNCFTNPNKVNESYENIVKKVQKYLIEKKLYPEVNPNGQNNNNMNNPQIFMNQNQIQQQQQQLQTLSSTDAQSENNNNRNIQQIMMQRAQNPQQVQAQIQISPEKWMESFNIYYFKNFIFYRKFTEEFYSQIDSMIALISNNINFQLMNNLNQMNIDINELRTDLENKRKLRQDNKDFVNYCTFSYFENFYFFTLFFLQEYHSFHKKNFYYTNSIAKEIKEYFTSSHNFFYNLRNYEDLNKIKEEQIELILNERDRERENGNKNPKKYTFYILCIYPDIILSSFLFFFRCDEIMEKYYSVLLELFLNTYRYFRDKFYDPLLEYLVKIIMTNKILKNKFEEKNIFMLKFLKSYDQLNVYKIVRTSENIIIIFKNYLESYLNEPHTNKKDINILKSLRMILYIIAKFELKNRKEIFELIKNYIGKNIIDGLKWIFSYDENEGDYYIYFETIPLSIDFFLSFFDEDTKLIMNENNFSKFKILQKFTDENDINMEIEESMENNNEIENESDMDKYDKNRFIKKMVDGCNLITKDKKVSDLLDPIRSIITSENSSYYKIFVVIFTQIWKMLSMSEREILNMYINEFFYKYAAKQKDRTNCIMAINLLLGAFSQCSPMIYIKPLIIQSLIPFQNFWSTHILYLENLLINGIDIPITYNSLISIFNSLKEDGLCNGLKYYFSDNNFSKEGYSELQAGNYLNAENIFYECFEKLNKDILSKIDNINVEEFNLEDENLELFNELSSWEEGLIDCYEKNDNWSNIIELGEKMNNNDLKLKGLWHYGNEKWPSLDDFVKDIPQYLKPERIDRNLGIERNNLKNSYIIQINEIYSIFKKLIEDNNDDANINNKCQTTCMKCIQNIYQNFSTLHPKNLEIIDYYYFLIFQLAVESWESTNTLNEIIKKLRENTQFNFKDNLLLWRERLPHYCEGFNALRNVLEPRNYLFKSLQVLVNNRGNENARCLPHYSDKVWTDMIYMKYARKLGLIETFYEKKSLFEEEHKDMIKIYPYEMYLKEMEYIKLIRNNTYNYDLGIKVCDNAIEKFRFILDDTNKDFVDYICNNFNRNKAYFYYKKGGIIEAHNLFIDASVYKNKQSTDYHLYNDWGDMCEEIAKLTKDSEECTEWFNNTIHNYIYTIIYKLDKAKFIIPRMIDFIREFDKESLKNKFDKDLDEIPVWIWLFWLPVLFENFNNYQYKEEKNDFFFYILKKVANKYEQMFYYPYKVYNKIIREKNMTNSEFSINQKYDELLNIISSENKYSHFIDKIDIIINELKKKEENNRENSLNSILTLGENNTFRMDNINILKEFFKKVATYLGSFPDLKYFTNDIINLMDSPDVTRSQLREFVIKNKYYIHNLIVTENKYEKLSKLINEKLYNTDFSNIEIPGYFSNKMIEPNEQNIIYISKLESEYSYKLITDARAKVLIRCSNDKLMSFILENQDADKNIDKKIYIMQLLFNYIFEKNYETYKRKVKFYVPIKYFISSKIKIIEEDIYYKYNMDEIYEYCLQKRGYFPHIAYQIFEEEGKKNKLDSNYLYYSEKNNEKLFKRMCKILPQDSFKNFVHKFILTSEDILLFRKQFTTSYSVNNLMNFIILDNTILKNISFNKETGLCVFNTDLSMFADNEYKELIQQKQGTPLRLTKNINYFLNVTSIYGIIPGVFNFSCKALLNKPKILKSILKICLDNNSERIANNYMNKFKYVLNILDDKEYFNNKSFGNNMIIENMDENNNKKEVKDGNMKNIFELIDNSMSDEKLMRKSIDYEAWF